MLQQFHSDWKKSIKKKLTVTITISILSLGHDVFGGIYFIELNNDASISSTESTICRSLGRSESD